MELTPSTSCSRFNLPLSRQGVAFASLDSLLIHYLVIWINDSLPSYRIVHVHPPFTRKRIVPLYFGQDVRTRLGVASFQISGPPVFHIKVGRLVKFLAQEHNKRTCRLVLHNLSKCQAPSKEAVDTIFKVFWFDPTREMNPRSTDCEEDALTTTP